MLIKREDYRGKCYECGIDVVVMDRETFLDHMVTAHQYKRYGNTVYKSKVCVACSKAALYKVGALGFCSEHRCLAVKWRNQIDAHFFEPVHQEISKLMKERDYVDIARKSLHVTRRKHR